MDQNPFAGLPKSPKQLKAEADAALVKATQEANDLLNELNGQPPGSDKYKMPPREAPGEEPQRDPVASIANTLPPGLDDAEHGNWQQLGEGGWSGKPLPVSTTLDVASKIRDGLNPHRRT